MREFLNSILDYVAENGRTPWYWTAAKLLGWSDPEKFDCETAWIDHAVLKNRRRVEKDAKAAVNFSRRHLGVIFTTVAIAALAYQEGLPWWRAVAIILAAYIGLTMVAGLALYGSD